MKQYCSQKMKAKGQVAIFVLIKCLVRRSDVVTAI